MLPRRQDHAGFERKKRTHSKEGREIIRVLEKDGWVQVGQTGSHVHFKHDRKPGKITVPHPVKNLPIGTFRSIEKHSGVKLT